MRQPSQKSEKKLLHLKKWPIEGRTLNTPLISGKCVLEASFCTHLSRSLHYQPKHRLNQDSSTVELNGFLTTQPSFLILFFISVVVVFSF